MARKPKHEEHENHERWLVSYADFITLLFAFFVVMYSVSSVNEGKYRVLSDAMVASFQESQKSLKPIQVGKTARSPQQANLVFSDTSTPIPTPESTMKMVTRANKNEGQHQEQEMDFSEFPMAEARLVSEGQESDSSESGANTQGLSEAQLGAIANEIEAAMQPLIDRDLISVKRTRRWIEVEIKTDILFASGSANMQPQSIPVLEALSGILAAFPNDMRIEGFTDNVAIKSSIYPSNWELSAARASSVVRLFSVNGVEPERMAAIGYGEFRPLMSNETLEGRTKNRRVMVVVTANRHMKRPKPEVEELPPEPETGESDSTLANSDWSRLDALLESSGLHRTMPVSIDALQPSDIIGQDSIAVDMPVWVPAQFIAPPIKFLSPVAIPAVNIRASLSTPIGSSIGGK